MQIREGKQKRVESKLLHEAFATTSNGWFFINYDVRRKWKNYCLYGYIFMCREKKKWEETIQVRLLCLWSNLFLKIQEIGSRLWIIVYLTWPIPVEPYLFHLVSKAQFHHQNLQSQINGMLRHSFLRLKKIFLCSILFSPNAAFTLLLLIELHFLLAC